LTSGFEMGPGKLLRYDRTPTPFECDRSEVIIGMPFGRWIARVVLTFLCKL